MSFNNTQDSATFPVCSFMIIFKTEIIKYNRRCPCLQWNKIINFLCTFALKAERNKSQDMLKNSKSTSITHLELHHFTGFPVTGEFFKAVIIIMNKTKNWGKKKCYSNNLLQLHFCFLSSSPCLDRIFIL